MTLNHETNVLRQVAQRPVPGTVPYEVYDRFPGPGWTHVFAAPGPPAPEIAYLDAAPPANHGHCGGARGADAALAIAGSFRHRQSDAHGHEHASARAIEALADTLEHRTYAMRQ